MRHGERALHNTKSRYPHDLSRIPDRNVSAGRTSTRRRYLPDNGIQRQCLSAAGTRGQYIWTGPRTTTSRWRSTIQTKRYSVACGVLQPSNSRGKRRRGRHMGRADTTFQMPRACRQPTPGAEYLPVCFFVTRSIMRFRCSGWPDSILAWPIFPAVFLSHSFEYSSWSKVYGHKEPNIRTSGARRDGDGRIQIDGEICATRTGSSITIRADSITGALFPTASSFRAQPWEVRYFD